MEKSKMDWVDLLASQQTDFIQRVKLGSILHCQASGQHSELVLISKERVEFLRNFCWEMIDKYRRSFNLASAREMFVNNMKGKLGEEAIKNILGELVSDVDYEKYCGGDGKVDFTLAKEPSVGIQVKARQGNIESAKWWFESEEIQKNNLLICALIQEEVHEAQLEYKVVVAGFVPTSGIALNLVCSRGGKVELNASQLLYGGGIRSYINQATKSASDYRLWERVLKQIEKNEIATSPVLELCKKHATLLSFCGETAVVGTYSSQLCQLFQKHFTAIENAFEIACNCPVKLTIKIWRPQPPTNQLLVNKQVKFGS